MIRDGATSRYDESVATVTTSESEAREAAAPTCLGTDLGWLLAQAQHVLATELTAALAPLEVAPRDVCALTTAASASYTQIELARAVGVDKTTMVVMLDELEAAGLAERRPSPADRRARIVAVTPKGRRRLAQAQRIVGRVQEDVLTTLPVASRVGLVEALGRLVSDRLAEPMPCEQAVRRPRSPA